MRLSRSPTPNWVPARSTSNPCTTSSATGQLMPARWVFPSSSLAPDAKSSVNLQSIWKRLTGRSEASPPTTAPARLNPELRGEIRRSFNTAAHDEDHFPATIDPRILHVQIL